jgi:cyanophycinase-like exopeptidase
VAQGDTMWVVGSGSVTVVDGRSLEATTVSEADLTSPLTLTHLTLHVLSQGFGLRVSTRTPIPYPLADTVPPLRKDEQGKEQGGSGG